MWVTTEAYDQQVVLVAKQAGAGVAGPLNGAKMLIFSGAPDLRKTSVLADLAPTEAAFAGYARVVLTWGTGERSEAGDIVTRSQLVSFQGTGVGLPFLVTGVAVVNSAGTVLYLAQMLAAAFPLNDALDALNLTAYWDANNPNAGTVELAA